MADTSRIPDLELSLVKAQSALFSKSRRQVARLVIAS